MLKVFCGMLIGLAMVPVAVLVTLEVAKKQPSAAPTQPSEPNKVRQPDPPAKDQPPKKPAEKGKPEPVANPPVKPPEPKRTKPTAVDNWLRYDEIKTHDVGRVSYNTGDKRPALYTVLQIIDQDNALIRMGDDTVWFVRPTAGMLDGKGYAMSECVWASGTRQYKTPLGTTKTVLVLEALEPE